MMSKCFFLFVIAGSSGYGSGSDDGASLSDFPIASADETTKPARECDVMKFSNTDSLCDSLKIIMQMPDMCDLTFLVGKKQVPIYGLRAILGTRSRYDYFSIAIVTKNMKFYSNSYSDNVPRYKPCYGKNLLYMRIPSRKKASVFDCIVYVLKLNQLFFI